MPFPLVVIVAAAVIAAVAATAAAAALWPHAKGKSIVVLGATAAGKTTLTEFMSAGTIPAEYVRTAGTRQHTVRQDVRMRDLKLKVDKILDVAGDKEAWERWLAAARKADLILYLINHEERDRSGYSDKVRRDSGQIAEWRRGGELPANVPVLLVVTHCDTEPGFETFHTDVTAVLKHVRDTRAVREAKRELGAGTPLVAGALRPVEYAPELVYQILEATGWSERDG